ncbi:MAG: hypothetical protein RDV48_12375, partial [Candidatus Eremiobacteraeota bacterium]|nr:hypothetical protein [Candidatus Eremiobacteraeota bacterium]
MMLAMGLMAPFTSIVGVLCSLMTLMMAVLFMSLGFTMAFPVIIAMSLVITMGMSVTPLQVPLCPGSYPLYVPVNLVPELPYIPLCPGSYILNIPVNLVPELPYIPLCPGSYILN